MNRFSKIMKEALERAEHVECSYEDFQSGLATMYHLLKERLELEGVDPEDADLSELMEDVDGDVEEDE